ncbi:hypothetical protein D3C78_567520 [compost metagenome]
MSCHQQLAHLFDEDRRLDALVEQHLGLDQSFAVEQLFGPVHRDVGDVVEVEAKQVAFPFQHADDAEAHAADPHPLAQRIGRAEQFLAEAMAEHHVGRRAAVVGRREEAAEGHAYLPGADQVGAGAVDVDAAGALGCLDVAVAVDDRQHRLHMGQPAQCFGVGDAQRAGAGEQAAEAAGLQAAGAHGDHPCAELREAIQHPCA